MVGSASLSELLITGVLQQSSMETCQSLPGPMTTTSMFFADEILLFHLKLLTIFFSVITSTSWQGESQLAVCCPKMKTWTAISKLWFWNQAVLCFGLFPFLGLTFRFTSSFSINPICGFGQSWSFQRKFPLPKFKPEMSLVKQCWQQNTCFYGEFQLQTIHLYTHIYIGFISFYALKLKFFSHDSTIRLQNETSFSQVNAA